MSKETITVEVTSEVALAYLSAPAEQQKKMSRLFEICLKPEQVQARLDVADAVRALQAGSVAKGTQNISAVEIESEIQTVRQQRRL